MDVIQRYQRLTEQRTYQRRVQAFGLVALLAPYKVPALPPTVVPQQRRARRLAVGR